MGQSNLFNINLADIGKGLLVAGLSTFLGAAYNTVSQGHLPSVPEIGTMAQYSLTSSVAYLIKNLFTGSNNQILKP